MFVLLFLLMLIPATAHAYIDPSTGSMALQAAIGLLLSALFVVKLYWRKLRSFAARLIGGQRDAGGK